jgi:hypothetical protein
MLINNIDVLDDLFVVYLMKLLFFVVEVDVE